MLCKKLDISRWSWESHCLAACVVYIHSLNGIPNLGLEVSILIESGLAQHTIVDIIGQPYFVPQAAHHIFFQHVINQKSILRFFSKSTRVSIMCWFICLADDFGFGSGFTTLWAVTCRNIQLPTAFSRQVTGTVSRIHVQLAGVTPRWRATANQDFQYQSVHSEKPYAGDS